MPYRSTGASLFRVLLGASTAERDLFRDQRGAGKGVA